jgi:N-acetylglutamate synthase-like GNAT family acetyltransferase
VAARKPPPPTIRQYRRTDDAQIWALAALPAVPAADAGLPPIPLPGADQPPPDLPDLADIAERFLRTGGDFLVAEISGDLVGTAGLLLSDRDTADVVLVRVHPAVRRRGIGTALVAAVEWRAEGLGVHRLNLDVGDEPEAIAFYLASGFSQSDLDDEPEQQWDLGRFSKALKFLP